MPYREAAEIPGMDWKKEFRAFYLGRADINLERILPILDRTDRFVPASVENLTDADLPMLFSVLAAVYGLTQTHGNYYFYYYELIKKVIVLVMENFPESFAKLKATEKEKVLDFKRKLPEDEAVFVHIYQFTQGKAELPFGVIGNGATMKSALNRAVTSTSKTQAKPLVNERVAAALGQIDREYDEHFESVERKV